MGSVNSPEKLKYIDYPLLLKSHGSIEEIAYINEQIRKEDIIITSNLTFNCPQTALESQFESFIDFSLLSSINFLGKLTVEWFEDNFQFQPSIYTLKWKLFAIGE